MTANTVGMASAAISRGSPAATSVPNTASRMSSAIGRLIGLGHDQVLLDLLVELVVELRDAGDLHLDAGGRVHRIGQAG